MLQILVWGGGGDLFHHLFTENHLNKSDLYCCFLIQTQFHLISLPATASYKLLLVQPHFLVFLSLCQAAYLASYCKGHVIVNFDYWKWGILIKLSCGSQHFPPVSSNISAVHWCNRFLAGLFTFLSGQPVVNQLRASGRSWFRTIIMTKKSTNHNFFVLSFTTLCFVVQVEEKSTCPTPFFDCPNFSRYTPTKIVKQTNNNINSCSPVLCLFWKFMQSNVVILLFSVQNYCFYLAVIFHQLLDNTLECYSATETEKAVQPISCTSYNYQNNCKWLFRLKIWVLSMYKQNE